MEYDREKYKVWKLPNVLLLHWVLNPALAVNEIFLGQRVPKVMLIDTTSTAPLMARQYVPCEKCGTFHDSRLWAKSNAFGHWFGIICPKCGEKIPCLLNIASLIILVVTFPLWIVLKSLFEKRWLQYEKTRFNSKMEQLPAGGGKKLWIRMGFFYGSIMFIIMNISKIINNRFSVKECVLQLITWSIGGLLFGFVMKYISGKKKHTS